jgi:hypothetical protein
MLLLFCLEADRPNPFDLLRSPAATSSCRDAELLPADIRPPGDSRTPVQSACGLLAVNTEGAGSTTAGISVYDR